MPYLSIQMACRRLPYYHRFLHKENFSSPLKVVYRKPLKEEKRYTGKYQWDLIHNPESVLFAWLEEEEEGEVTAGTYYWTPAGTPILMSKDAPTILDLLKLKSGEHINGILYAWRDDKKVYAAKIENGLFKGYFVANAKVSVNGVEITGLTDEKFVDATDLKAGEKIPVNSIMYIGNCTKEDVITQYTVAQKINGPSYYENGKPLITSFTYTQGTKVKRLAINGCLDDNLQEYGQSIYNSNLDKVIGDDARTQLYKIAQLADALGKSYFEGIASGKTWDNNPESSNSYFAYYWALGNKPDYSVESLKGFVTILESYKTAIEKLKTTSESGTCTKEEILAIVNNYFVFGQDFKYFFDAPFKELSAIQRLNIIKVLIDGLVNGRTNVGSGWQEEDIILELFHTAKPEQHKELVDGVYSQKLLFRLVNGVDGDNFYKLTETLINWVIEIYPCPQNYDIKKSVEDKKYLLFNDNFFGRRNDEMMNQTGDVFLTVKKWFGDTEYEIPSPPYDYLLVKFKNNFEIGTSKFAAGETYKLPAMHVYMMFCSDTRDKWITSGRTALDVALFAVGAGEIKVAIEAGSWARAAIAVVDMGVGFTDIAVNDVFEKEVKTKYPGFYEKWQKISLIYGVGRLAQVGLEKLVQETSFESKVLKKATGISQKSRDAVARVETKIEQELSQQIATTSNKISNVTENIKTALKKHGYSDADIEYIININTLAAEGKALPEDVELMQLVFKECFTLPKAGAKMLKIIPMEFVKKFHLGDDLKTAVTGRKYVDRFVGRAEDFKAGSSQQIIENYRLNYSGTNFKEAEGYAVIEYTNPNSGLEYTFENSLAKAEPLPNTNTGMTGSSERIVPEYFQATGHNLEEGDKLKLYKANGSPNGIFELIKDKQGNFVWKEVL